VAVLANNLRGRTANAKTRAALDFAAAIVSEWGHVRDEQLRAVRAGGYNKTEVVEIVANVVINIFTNYFNLIEGTVIDFPVVKSAA
jgi:alkylhydroperoxidase family enzyme